MPAVGLERERIQRVKRIERAEGRAVGASTNLVCCGDGSESRAGLDFRPG